MGFVNELFERLSKSNTASDVQEALIALGNIQDPGERDRAARETAVLINKYGQELVERGQHKNAAYQFFSGFQVIHRFLPDPNSENQWLRSSADALVHAAQDHISWEDLLGGAVCMTIASLLRIQTGDWNINQHLDEFIKAHDFSANQAATACLYIPYDLAGAVNPENPNPSIFQRASNYTETYLINTKQASMFKEGIKRSIELTQQKMMNFVKFPSLRTTYEFDHDIIFGEEFSFSVKLENKGEGTASNLVSQIEIPPSLTTVSGTNSISIPQLNSGASTKVEFSLICPSGEGKTEVAVEIPVNVEYEDILLNKNSISLGSAVVPIRSEKKAQKLMNQLKSVNDLINSEMDPMKSLTISEIQPLISSFSSILSKINSSTETNINEGEFTAASIGINQLNHMQEFIKPMVEFLQEYSEGSQDLLKGFHEIKENTETLLKSLEEIQNKLT
ncbi:MAG: CARDB domain-containing protein [Candidatus Hodarchaeales archaeon]